MGVHSEFTCQKFCSSGDVTTTATTAASMNGNDTHVDPIHHHKHSQQTKGGAIVRLVFMPNKASWPPECEFLFTADFLSLKKFRI